MPGRDGTGPGDAGAGTRRGMGGCVVGTGRRGIGIGRGSGRGSGRSGGMGIGRGSGRGRRSR